MAEPGFKTVIIPILFIKTSVAAGASVTCLGMQSCGTGIQARVFDSGPTALLTHRV